MQPHSNPLTTASGWLWRLVLNIIFKPRTNSPIHMLHHCPHAPYITQCLYANPCWHKQRTYDTSCIMRACKTFEEYFKKANYYLTENTQGFNRYCLLECQAVCFMDTDSHYKRTCYFHPKGQKPFYVQENREISLDKLVFTYLGATSLQTMIMSAPRVLQYYKPSPLQGPNL